MLDRKPICKAALQRDYPKRQSGSHVLEGAGVHVARLLALKGGVKLEGLGMKRRGKSCTMIVRQMFGLPISAKREELIARLEKEIKEFTL